jgi:protein-disulfide isomerase
VAAAISVMTALGLGAPARAQESLPVSGSAGATFTPAQRAEIVQILRDALRNDPSILRDAITSLRTDEQARQAQQDTKAVAANHEALFADPADPVVGNPHGRVTLVEFFDVRCPYCRRMRPAVEALVARNKDVRIVMKDLPILGPASVLGSEALLAAQQQGGYARLQSALMREGVTVDEQTVHRAALDAGLDWTRMQPVMNSDAVRKRLDANLRLAETLGLHGTPAVIFGDQIAPGALSLDDLQTVVNALRKTAG